MLLRTVVLLLWALSARAGSRRQAKQSLPSFRSTYTCKEAAKPTLAHCTFTDLAYFRGQLFLVVDDTSKVSMANIAVPTSEHLPNVLQQADDYPRVADFILPVTEVRSAKKLSF